jgi:hypothetical protein
MSDSASDVGDLTSDYFFSIKAGVSIQAQGKSIVGPSGARLYFGFNANKSRVWTKRRENTPPPAPFWEGFEGTLLSGGDFALLRLDGVLQLDGRLTLRSREGVLADATYKGTIDLVESARVAALIAEHSPQHKGLTKAIHALEASTFEDYARGQPLSAPLELPLLLYMAFEAANTPWTNAPGEDLSWPAKRYLAHEKDFWRYRLLMRRLFIATGKLTFDRTVPMGISGMELDILGLSAKAAIP